MTILLIIYTAVLAVLNGVRIMDSTYWFDEIFSIKLINMTIPEMLKATANDVHPPLYYVILKVFCHFFSQSGPALHAASLLPYVIVLILALTVIRRRFGRSTAFLFVTFMSLLQCTLRYNVEIRMYSWVVLFVLTAYLSLYAIFDGNRKRSYVLFTAASLAAAYSHYYALIAVAFFYLVLMLYALIVRREMVRRVIVTWAVTVVGYLGWLVVLLKTFARTSSGWWLSWMPTFRQSFDAIFRGKYSRELFYTYVAVTCICMVLWAVQKNTNLLFWSIAGTASVFGTIAVGVGVSHLFRPLYFDRYIYTAAVCAWLMVSVGVSQLRVSFGDSGLRVSVGALRAQEPHGDPRGRVMDGDSRMRVVDGDSCMRVVDGDSCMRVADGDSRMQEPAGAQRSGVRSIAPLSIILTIFVCVCGYYNYTTVYAQDAIEDRDTKATVQCIAEHTQDKEVPILTVKKTDDYILAYFRHRKRKRVDPGESEDLAAVLTEAEQPGAGASEVEAEQSGAGASGAEAAQSGAGASGAAAAQSAENTDLAEKSQSDMPPAEEKGRPADAKEHCLITNEPIAAEIAAELEEKGFACTEVRAELFQDDPDRGGFLGDLNVWVYVLTRK